MRDQKDKYKIPRGYQNVGVYLRQQRKNARLTQREVSLALGYSSAQFISNFERGIALPPLKKMKVLQELYRADVNQLIELTIEAERIHLAAALGGKSKRKPRKDS